MTHPGTSIRDSIEAMGWTVSECAKHLGTRRENLSRLLNGRIGISPAMALERIGWSNARFWLRRQAYFDLDQGAPPTSGIARRRTAA